MIIEMFSYPFLVRAFIVGILVSLSAALLGVPLVLKRFSMIGDGLSHVGFGAMTVALALNVTPLFIGIPVMILAAFALLGIRNSKVNTDASIAMISATSIAVGITAASLSGGMNTDVYGYMFGSILAVTDSDIIVSACLCALVVAVFIIFYNKIFASAFEANFITASGRSKTFDIVFALMTACTIVVGMKIMGTMLISGLIIFPAVTGMRLTKTFKGTVTVASIVSVTAFVSGMIASYAFEYIPAGAGIVLANLVLLGIFCLIKAIRRKV